MNNQIRQELETKLKAHIATKRQEIVPIGQNASTAKKDLKVEVDDEIIKLNVESHYKLWVIELVWELNILIGFVVQLMITDPKGPSLFLGFSALLASVSLTCYLHISLGSFEYRVYRDASVRSTLILISSTGQIVIIMIMVSLNVFDPTNVVFALLLLIQCWVDKKIKESEPEEDSLFRILVDLPGGSQDTEVITVARKPNRIEKCIMGLSYPSIGFYGVFSLTSIAPLITAAFFRYRRGRGERWNSDWYVPMVQARFLWVCLLLIAVIASLNNKPPILQCTITQANITRESRCIEQCTFVEVP